MRDGSLEGKTAFVTGGGTGIGRAVARRFTARGAHVAVVGRRLELLAEVAAETGAFAVRCDVSDGASVDAAVGATVAEFGGLDIVVNNAGIVHRGTVEGADDDSWASLVGVNVEGPAHVVRAAVPHMRARGGGAVVNVSSIGGLFAAPSAFLYATTKAALFGMTRSMAIDLGRDGIRVNTLCPGWVDTPMIDGALHRVAQLHDVSPDAARDVLVRHNPIRRLADPDEIASCIEFLASDASSFVTGTVLIADGGQSIVDLGTLPLAGP